MLGITSAISHLLVRGWIFFMFFKMPTLNVSVARRDRCQTSDSQSHCNGLGFPRLNKHAKFNLWFIRPYFSRACTRKHTRDVMTTHYAMSD